MPTGNTHNILGEKPFLVQLCRPQTPNIEKVQCIFHPIQKYKIKMYRTVILPVVFYGFETWTLTLREEHRLRVFENGVQGKIFGPKKDEVTERWRKLHSEELYALYCSPKLFG